MTNTTVTLSSATLNNLRYLASKGTKTVDELASEMLERGAKDAVYRSKRNAQKWQEQKALGERIKELEAALEAKGIDHSELEEELEPEELVGA
jgi:hypothetical protein